MQFWLVGAYWDDRDPPDQTFRFLAEGVWENGYADRYRDLVMQMRPGDRSPQDRSGRVEERFGVVGAELALLALLDVETPQADERLEIARARAGGDAMNARRLQALVEGSERYRVHGGSAREP